MQSNNELDTDLIIQAANPKIRKTIAIYSPEIAAVMWYLKETVPKFSISDVASHWIEEGIERDYPELVQKIREEMRWQTTDVPTENGRFQSRVLR